MRVKTVKDVKVLQMIGHWNRAWWLRPQAPPKAGGQGWDVYWRVRLVCGTDVWEPGAPLLGPLNVLPKGARAAAAGAGPLLEQGRLLWEAD